MYVDTKSERVDVMKKRRSRKWKGAEGEGVEVLLTGLTIISGVMP